MSANYSYPQLQKLDFHDTICLRCSFPPDTEREAVGCCGAGWLNIPLPSCDSFPQMHCSKMSHDVLGWPPNRTLLCLTSVCLSVFLREGGVYVRDWLRTFSDQISSTMWLDYMCIYSHFKKYLDPLMFCTFNCAIDFILNWSNLLLFIHNPKSVFIDLVWISSKAAMSALQDNCAGCLNGKQVTKIIISE